MTSAFCKSLYEDRVTLRTKHNALLAGIPVYPAASTVEFPSAPGTPTSLSPLSRNTSLPLSTTGSLVDASLTSLQPPFHTRRSRKISVSPSDLSLLSDQNAELLQKLEKLETESKQADQSGRRALRKLEKEIQGLRDELEMTQARSEELEEQARKGLGKGFESAVEEALKKKEERIARIRGLRGKGEELGSDGEEDEVRDFAPGRALTNAGWLNRPLSPSRRSGDAELSNSYPEDNFSPASASSHALHGYEGGDISPPDLPRDLEESSRAAPPQEYALISQLLLKIRELEETNIQIKLQQGETATKLQMVQRDTEHISKLYECLGDPSNVEWEVVDDDWERGKQVKNVLADDTIRFRSLRRALEGDMSKLGVNASNCAGVFENGIINDNCSTAHGNVQQNTTYKQRKSVVGLFDTRPGSRDQNGSIPGHHGYPLLHGHSTDSDSVQRSYSTSSLAISAPSLSSTPLHTLGSELGSEFGDDWGENAGNHFRTTSLGDLTDPGRRSRSPSLSRLSIHTQEKSDPTTPAQFTCQTPERSKIEQESVEDQRTPRYRRMSQTIRSRTSQWVNGRFKDTLLGPKSLPPVSDNDKDHVRPFVSLQRKIATAVDTFSGTFTGKPAVRDDRDEGDDTIQNIQLQAESNGTNFARGEKKAAVAFLLELWLWLQFAIIILVFLWAMAKRGPRTLLNDAERKRRATLGH